MVGNCLTEAMVTRRGVEEEERCLIQAQRYHRSEHRTGIFFSVELEREREKTSS